MNSIVSVCWIEMWENKHNGGWWLGALHRQRNHFWLREKGESEDVDDLFHWIASFKCEICFHGSAATAEGSNWMTDAAKLIFRNITEWKINTLRRWVEIEVPRPSQCIFSHFCRFSEKKYFLWWPPYLLQLSANVQTLPILRVSNK